MILSKRFLNEQVQKRVIHEDASYERSFYQRKELSNYDVFISYSWNDRAYANKVVQLLERCGYTVYIDYNDNLLNRSNVSEATAAKYFYDVNAPLPLDPLFEYPNTLDQTHKVVHPYADERNVCIFKDLQKFESAGLVQPVGEDHMYYAAMNSKSCMLTPLGKHFWYLVSQNKI